MQSNLVGREGTSIVQIGNGELIICIDFLRMMSHDSMSAVCVCACMCVVCVCACMCVVCVRACMCVVCACMCVRCVCVQMSNQIQQLQHSMAKPIINCDSIVTLHSNILCFK